MSEQPVWIVMPVMAGPEMTEAAIGDCLNQSIPTRILIVNQAVETSFRQRLERLAEEYSDRIFVWSHEPTLRSLSAAWNRALDFVWACGGQEALVVNNDVRLHPDTIKGLLYAKEQHKDPLFISCVGVTAEQFAEYQKLDYVPLAFDGPKGGPDFSCYLISRECHQAYRFDEGFIPAYCEDLDYHRRLMLDGNGDKIFSVNLPYLHLAAQTLKQSDPKKKAAIERSIEISRKHYLEKWGGPVNQETYYIPFGKDHNNDEHVSWLARCGPSTPEIQRWVQGGSDGRA